MRATKNALKKHGGIPGTGAGDHFHGGLYADGGGYQGPGYHGAYQRSIHSPPANWMITESSYVTPTITETPV